MDNIYCQPEQRRHMGRPNPERACSAELLAKLAPLHQQVLEKERDTVGSFLIIYMATQAGRT